MAITSNMGMGSQISPEQRALMTERKRIKSYINSYNRNPKQWSTSMVSQLEQLTAQYQIPFKRQIPDASAAWKAAGLLGGVADSAAFGLMPDKWYSDESNRKQANVGKIGGAAAQIAAAVAATVFSGGTAAPTIGAALKGLSSARGALATAKAAGMLGATVVSKGLPGRAATGAILQGKKTFGPLAAGKGYKWGENVVKANKLTKSEDIYKAATKAVDETADLGAVVKGKNLTPGQITLLTNQITDKYGVGSKVSKNFISQLKTHKSVNALDGVSKEQIVSMANKMVKTHNVNSANVKKLLKNAGASSSDDNVKFIVDKLKESNITKLDEKAISELLKMVGKTKSTPVATLGDVDKMGAAFTAAGALGAGSSLMDYTPSREELEKQEDPYDPYNL